MRDRDINITSENGSVSENSGTGRPKIRILILLSVIAGIILLLAAVAVLILPEAILNRDGTYFIGAERIDEQALISAAGGNSIKALKIRQDLASYAELDSLISELLEKYEPRNAEGEERKNLAILIRNELEDSGLAEKNSCEADENGNAVLFRYHDGTEGIIFFTLFSSEECGTDEEKTLSDDRNVYSQQYFPGLTVSADHGATARDEAEYVCSPEILLLSAYNSSDKYVQPEAINEDGEIDHGRYINFFDIYHDEYIQSLPTQLTVNTEARVADFLQFGDWDAVIIGAHGTVLNGKCCICLEEKVTAGKNLSYYDLLRNGAVIRGFDSNGGYYLVREELFSTGSCGDLSGTFIFVESCGFFGRDSVSFTPDTSFADAMINAGASGVAGFHNSVLNDYAIGLIGKTLDAMCRGSSFKSALSEAKLICGEDDSAHRQGDESFSTAAAYPCFVLAGDDFSFQTDQKSLK